MVQKNQFVAVAAGVVVHQHTRVLMADLHRRGDGMGAEGVRAGLQQLASELAVAYKAAAVGPAEIQRVVTVVELASGPQGKAAIDRRVAEANARIAEALCSCAVCTEAATRTRGQSRLVERAALVWLNNWRRQWAAHRRMVDEHQRPTVAILPPTRQQKERERKKANSNKRGRKKAGLGGVGQHGDPGEVVQQLEGSQQKSEGAVAT